LPDGGVFDGRGRAAGPDDVDRFYRILTAETEVRDRFHLTQVAASGVDRPPLNA
jgi:hypothetical protein